MYKKWAIFNFMKLRLPKERSNFYLGLASIRSIGFEDFVQDIRPIFWGRLGEGEKSDDKRGIASWAYTIRGWTPLSRTAYYSHIPQEIFGVIFLNRFSVFLG